MNILDQANKIVHDRLEESVRNYGPFDESMTRAADMFNLMTMDVQLKPEHIYKVMVALKLSREYYAHKEDSLLDCVAYLGALNDFYNKE